MKDKGFVGYSSGVKQGQRGDFDFGVGGGRKGSNPDHCVSGGGKEGKQVVFVEAAGHRWDQWVWGLEHCHWDGR